MGSELKLVEKDQEEKRKNNALSGLVVPERNERFDYDVRISYYYDPVYNPYGVAPPGKQILYHSNNDGGFTKNRRHGIVPDKYLTDEEKLAIQEMELDHDKGDEDEDIQEEEEQQQKQVIP